MSTIDDLLKQMNEIERANNPELVAIERTLRSELADIMKSPNENQLPRLLSLKEKIEENLCESSTSFASFELVRQEIKDYCQRATRSDGTSIYTPIFGKKMAKLIIKPKPGFKFPPRSLAINNYYQLIRMVEFLSIASSLYPNDPIEHHPDRMAKILEELIKRANKKTEEERRWESSLKLYSLSSSIQSVLDAITRSQPTGHR